jgi:hypothetical protein
LHDLLDSGLTNEIQTSPLELKKFNDAVEALCEGLAAKDETDGKRPHLRFLQTRDEVQTALRKRLGQKSGGRSRQDDDASAIYRALLLQQRTEDGTVVGAMLKAGGKHVVLRPIVALSKRNGTGVPTKCTLDKSVPALSNEHPLFDDALSGGAKFLNFRFGELHPNVSYSPLSVALVLKLAEATVFQIIETGGTLAAVVDVASAVCPLAVAIANKQKNVVTWIFNKARFREDELYQEIGHPNMLKELEKQVLKMGQMNNSQALRATVEAMARGEKLDYVQPIALFDDRIYQRPLAGNERSSKPRPIPPPQFNDNGFYDDASDNTAMYSISVEPANDLYGAAYIEPDGGGLYNEMPGGAGAYEEAIAGEMYTAASYAFAPAPQPSPHLPETRSIRSKLGLLGALLELCGKDGKSRHFVVEHQKLAAIEVHDFSPELGEREKKDISALPATLVHHAIFSTGTNLLDAASERALVNVVNKLLKVGQSDLVKRCLPKPGESFDKIQTRTRNSFSINIFYVFYRSKMRSHVYLV